MKRIPLIFIMLLTLTSLYAEEVILGGVDVGNGMVVPTGFELPENFTSEEDMLQKFELIKEEIKQGKHKYVQGLVRLGDCRGSKIDIGELHVKRKYGLTKDKKLKKQIKGVVKLGLYKCKHPSVVQVSERTFNLD